MGYVGVWEADGTFRSGLIVSYVENPKKKNYFWILSEYAVQ